MDVCVCMIPTSVRIYNLLLLSLSLTHTHTYTHTHTHTRTQAATCPIVPPPMRVRVHPAARRPKVRRSLTLKPRSSLVIKMSVSGPQQGVRTRSNAVPFLSTINEVNGVHMHEEQEVKRRDETSQQRSQSQRPHRHARSSVQRRSLSVRRLIPKHYSTLTELVARLVHPAGDLYFRKCFFLTMKYFAKPSDVLHDLLAYLHVPPPKTSVTTAIEEDDCVYVENNISTWQQCRIRVLAVLKYWAKAHPSDFVRREDKILVRDALNKFPKKEWRKTHVKSILVLSAIKSTVLTAFTTYTTKKYRKQHSVFSMSSSNKIKKMMISGTFVSVFKYKSSALAAALTHLGMERMRAIEPRDFVKKGYRDCPERNQMKLYVCALCVCVCVCVIFVCVCVVVK